MSKETWEQMAYDFKLAFGKKLRKKTTLSKDDLKDNSVELAEKPN